jgi:hypothetical protein
VGYRRVVHLLHSVIVRDGEALGSSRGSEMATLLARHSTLFSTKPL